MTVNVSEGCGNVTQDTDGRTTQTVQINIIDANDNPPMFEVAEIPFGMRRVTEVGTILELVLKVFRRKQRQHNA